MQAQTWRQRPGTTPFRSCPKNCISLAGTVKIFGFTSSLGGGQNKQVLEQEGFGFTRFFFGEYNLVSDLNSQVEQYFRLSKEQFACQVYL